MAGGMCGWGCAWQGGVCGGGGACMAGETATAADSTHPTGMHSCHKFIHNTELISDGSKIFQRGSNLIFGKMFTENCMKMKEIGPTQPPLGSTAPD